jgi:YHS domain-containing protein
MFRLLFLLISLVLLISIIRMVAGVLLKGLGALFEPAPTPQNASRTVPMGGELKKDPVCGTFVSAAASVKKSIGGSVMHFCSAECRDKFHG